MTEKTNSTGNLTFMDGVWLVNRLYQDGLSHIGIIYENAPAAEDLQSTLEEIDQKITNNVLLNGYLKERAGDLGKVFKISMSRKR